MSNVGIDKILNNNMDNDAEAMSDYMAGQIEKQFIKRHEPKEHVKVEIEPFIKALETLSDERYETLHRVLDPGTIDNIQELYKSGQATPQEVVLFYIKRVIEYNHLNAINTLNPEVLDLVAELGPYDESKSLYGIPVLLKDNVATGDKMANTGGSVYLKNSIADRDAFIVKKIRQAGGLILGKANLSEFANFMTYTSSNGYTALGGQTTNPYGLFDVGGSSSGSAVAVALNLAPITIGTETAGSLIYPASQNNVVTIKPTAGLVSRDLIIPISDTQDTAGPMANTIKDASVLLEVISGEDHRDEKTHGCIVGNYSDNVKLESLRIGVITNDAVIGQFGEKDKKCQEKTLTVLEKRGLKIDQVKLEDACFELNMMDVLLYEFKRDLNGYLSNVALNSKGSLKELIEFNNEDLENRCHYGQSILEESQNFPMSEGSYKKIVDNNTSVATKAMDQVFESYDVLISVSNIATTPYACGGYPALNIPTYFSEDGEPVGITLIGDKFKEINLIVLGTYLESQLKGRQMPNICE